MVKPRKLCVKHLIGEHGEIHKAVGNLRYTGNWVRALAAKGFLEPQNFRRRHGALVKEMLARGFNHASPLNAIGLPVVEGVVDAGRSERDLRERCSNCFNLKGGLK